MREKSYLCAMRTLAHIAVFALVWAGVGRAHDEKKTSKMVLKVEKAQVEAAQKSLKSLAGVKSVKYEEQQGQLVVLYDKKKLGCCSRIHTALKEAGIQYTLVSNEEYPACSDKHEGEHSEAGGAGVPVQHTSSGKKKGGCCKAGAQKAACTH